LGEKRGGIFGRCGYRICDRGREGNDRPERAWKRSARCSRSDPPQEKAIRPPINDHGRCRVPALSAVGSGAGVPSQSQASRGRELLSPPASTASLPGRPARPACPWGFFRLGVRETWPCGGAAQRRSAVPCCAEPREQPHMAAHGGAWSHDSRVGIGRPRRWNLPFVHFLGSLLAPGQPLPLSLRVIRLLFSFPLVPWPVGVACV